MFVFKNNNNRSAVLTHYALIHKKSFKHKLLVVDKHGIQVTEIRNIKSSYYIKCVTRFLKVWMHTVEANNLKTYRNNSQQTMQ